MDRNISIDRASLKEWNDYILVQLDQTAQELSPVVRELQYLIESDPSIYMLVSAMFEQIPNKDPYTNDPLGRPQIRDYRHLLEVINHIIVTGPKWNTAAYRAGYGALPILAILNWPMATEAGKSLFLNKKINDQFKKILDEWGKYLSSAESTTVLTTEPDGWLSPDAIREAERVANAHSMVKGTFAEVYECDPSQPHHGFKSWDDFFTRRFRAGVRPIASPDSQQVIVNACESEPYRLATGIALRDKFWIKSQPYSLIDLLGHDKLASYFEGGSIYQTYLGTLTYHRWHSPVSGRVVRVTIQPGTYFSKAMYEGFGAAHESLLTSQGYLAAVATRAVIFIQADNPAIGLVCFVPIGMAEVSTCEANVKEGQHVAKGEELGKFHFGGSSCCLLFGPNVKLKWTEEATMRGSFKGNIPVNSRLAVVQEM